MATKIKASVGRRGKNNTDDVKIVQELFKPFASKLKVSPIKVDGKPSSALEKAIGKFQEEICQFKPDLRVDPGKTTFKKLAAGPSKAEAERKAQESANKRLLEDRQKKVLAEIKKNAAKEAKTLGFDTKGAKQMYAELESFASSQWDSLMAKADSFDPKQLAKSAEDVLKQAIGRGSVMSEMVEKAKEDEVCGPDHKVPLKLTGSVQPIKSGGFTFSASGNSPDPKAKILLLPDKNTSLAVDITGGWSKKTMVPLFKGLDSAGLWGKTIAFYAVETTNGKPDMNTLSNAVKLATPVAPFKGTVSLEGIAKDKGMTYTGNGKGRFFYTTPINGWYFLKYGPNFERDPAMRGFDCITYVGSAHKKMRGMGGRGDGLASELGASKVDMEDKEKSDVIEFFNGDGKSGKYIAWWSTHCIAIKNGTVHEYSQSKGGYKSSKATSYGWPSKGTYVRKL